MLLALTPLLALADGQTRLIILIGYMALLLILGFFASRWFSGTKSDYLLASHSIGPFLLLMSMFGTTMTAFALVGSTGEAYTKGIGVYAMLASASGIMHSLCFFVIGIKIYQFGRKYGYTTQVQFFRDRLESDFVGVLMFPILVALIIPYLLIGVIAGGKMIEVMTVGALPLDMLSANGSVPPWLGSLVICLVVLSYVFFGGMRGTAWANAFQTTVFMVLGVVTFVLLANKMGKGETFFQSVSNLSESLSQSKGTREGIRHTKYLTYMLIPLSVGMFPHLFQHWLTARSAKTFRLPVILHPIFIMIVWAPCVLIGAWASTLALPTGISPNAVLPMLVNTQIGPIMGGFLAAGILAAIMSSLDSQFLCLGTMFTTDVVSHYNRKVGDRAQVWFARAFIVVIVGITYVLSLVDGSKSVFTMAIWCFSGFTGLFPIVVAALYWKKLTAAGVVSGTIAMLFSWVYLFRDSGWGAERDYVVELYSNEVPVMPVTVIILCSTLAMVITSLLTRPPSQKTLDKFFPTNESN